MEYSIVKGLCWYRLVTAFWALGILVASYEKLQQKYLAIFFCAVLIIASVIQKVISNRATAVLLKKELVLGELIFALSITIIGGYLYETGSSSNTLAFASHYVLVSVLMCGVAFGLIGGVVSGIFVGGARFLASIVNDSNFHSSSFLLSLLSTTFTYLMAGALVGGVVAMVKKAGGELSEARARDNIARTLHDGVLQTLVVIQKRSSEDTIRDLANSQEQELREFLFVYGSDSSDSLIDIHNILREVANKFEKENIPISIVVAPDITKISKQNLKALRGAVMECVNNSIKHSQAKSISIYAEPVEDNFVEVTVRDDGKGFKVDDNSNENLKQGIKSSVIGRIEEIGGQVLITSSENGTQTLMRVPSKEK